MTAAGGAANILTFLGGVAATPRFFLASGVASTTYGVVQTARDGTPTAATNTLTFAGNATMTDGNLDIYIIRLPQTLVTLLPKESVSTQLSLLKKQIERLSLATGWADEYDDMSSATSASGRPRHHFDHFAAPKLGKK
jgi:hypothetical protein